MKKMFFYCTLALFCAMSCQQEIEQPDSGLDYSAEPITASIEQQTASTKTVIDISNNVLWMKGDQIALFKKTTIPMKYQIDDAAHLKTSGTFRKVAVQEDNLHVGTETNAMVAFYPYADIQLRATDLNGAFEISDYILPSVQYCVEPVDETDAELLKRCPSKLPMLYASTEMDNYINFKNVLGLLGLNLTGNGNIRKIEFYGNNKEIICGNSYLSIKPNMDPTIYLDDPTQTKITLDCGEAGFPLYPEFDRAIMLAIPPTVFEKGFTLNITYTDGMTETIRTDLRQEIKRSRILNMPVLTLKDFDLTLDKDVLTFDDHVHTLPLLVRSAKAWQITSTLPDWLKVDIQSNVPLPMNQSIVTVKAAPLAGGERSAELIFSNGKMEKTLTVNQKSDIVLCNDFDKEAATMTWGPTASYWPYLNQFEGWNNNAGSAVTPDIYYEHNKVTTRNIASSDIEAYSSGLNHLYFVPGSSLIIKGIDLTGQKNIQLEFSSSRFLYGELEPNYIVNPADFHVYLSNNGEQWVELSYSQIMGMSATSWQTFNSSLSLPDGTSRVFIAIRNTSAVANVGYRLDDLKILKSTTPGTAIDFNQGTYVEGISPKAPEAGSIFFEDFFNGSEGWTMDNKVIDPQMTYVWTAAIHGTDRFMKAGAYISGIGTLASESWLISPEINLTTVPAAFLSFRHALNKLGIGQTTADHITLLITKDNGLTWNPIAIPVLPAGTDWNFINSGDIDLAPYLGSTIKLAFKYVSTATSAPTWEVTDIKINTTK